MGKHHADMFAVTMNRGRPQPTWRRPIRVMHDLGTPNVIMGAIVLDTGRLLQQNGFVITPNLCEFVNPFNGTTFEEVRFVVYRA